MIEIKHSKIRRKTVDLRTSGPRPSRIRRDPVPVEKKREPISRETEITFAIAGVVLFATAIAFVIAGFNVVMGKDDGAKAAPVSAPEFGSCEGGANCVIDADTIRIAGSTVKIAGMAAPSIQSPHCAEEKQAGVEAVQALTGLLNSGKVITGDEVDSPDGLVRRTVLVNGKDVGAAMVSAGLARAPGSSGDWCSE